MKFVTFQLCIKEITWTLEPDPAYMFIGGETIPYSTTFQASNPIDQNHDHPEN